MAYDGEYADKVRAFRAQQEQNKLAMMERMKQAELKNELTKQFGTDNPANILSMKQKDMDAADMQRRVALMKEFAPESFNNGGINLMTGTIDPTKARLSVDPAAASRVAQQETAGKLIDSLYSKEVDELGRVKYTPRVANADQYVNYLVGNILGPGYAASQQAQQRSALEQAAGVPAGSRNPNESLKSLIQSRQQEGIPATTPAPQRGGGGSMTLADGRTIYYSNPDNAVPASTIPQPVPAAQASAGNYGTMTVNGKTTVYKNTDKAGQMTPVNLPSYNQAQASPMPNQRSNTPAYNWQGANTPSVPTMETVTPTPETTRIQPRSPNYPPNIAAGTQEKNLGPFGSLQKPTAKNSFTSFVQDATPVANAVQQNPNLTAMAIAPPLAVPMGIYEGAKALYPGVKSMWNQGRTALSSSLRTLRKKQ